MAELRIGTRRVYLAEAAGARGGVLLYPTIMGIDAAMRGFADAFATNGASAVVWDPYDGEVEAGPVAEMLARSKECEDRRVVAALQEIVGYMCGTLGVERIVGIGWCFGGRIGLLHAGSDQRVSALSAYNPTIYSPIPVEIAGIGSISRADFPGQTMDEFALASAIAGPVQVSRPERDFTRPTEYQRLFEALCERSDPTLYEFHPGAAHGFSYTPGEANQRAHRVAWATTLGLFDQALT